ncbi:FadR family transcriptional regulator [Bacillus sp. sid0103]|uniref:FadR/GntR family transcriptional regulator n=1 Tax=Bacillus sp. sid0103 TaxID=2856337 RepID=UPI001C466793|nr:FadR/GntR family transcriptional regulator [Bacillus sp. sid0103]MBV7507584.1 FadR family transcriptional regulator [Bacillus sp. sid0103]
MKSIKKVPMHEMIAEEIKRFINKHHLKRGDKLPSVGELTTILGVSRTSIREGLRFLEGIEIIEVLNGKGIFVKDAGSLKIEAKINIEQETNSLLHIIELRRALEGKAVELATLRATDEEIQEMEKLITEVIALKDARMDSSSVDWAFHQAIYKASHNPLLESVADSVSVAFNKLWKKPFGIDHIFEDTLPYHVTMLEGIKQGDPVHALREFNKIVDAVERTVQMIKEKGTEND